MTELAPLAIEPVRVPPSVPVPVWRLRATPVVEVTLAGLPLASWAWTTTLKAAPADGLAGVDRGDREPGRGPGTAAGGDGEPCPTR